MQQKLNTTFFVLCLMLIAGIFLIDYIRILPSMSMIGITLLGIYYATKKTFQDAYQPFISLACTFVILVPSIFYSSNLEYLLEKWQIALPYLLLPLAFYTIPKLTDKQYQIIYQFYFLMCLIVSLIAFVYYLFHQDFINQLYLESRVMPTIFTHHPTLSLMFVLGAFVAYWLSRIQHITFFAWEKYLHLAGGLFLFIFIHIFSVRSGLLALYIVVITELVRRAYASRNIRQSIISGLVLFITGAITLFVSPTVSNKLANTTKDLNAYQNNQSANHQSLSSRIISYTNAIEIARTHGWLTGCGLGDVRDENDRLFEVYHPEVSKRILPHNQFLFYLAAIGVLGMLLFIIFFYYPLFFKKAYLHPLLLIHLIIVSVGFQFEMPLETQVGVAFSLSFYILPLHMLKKS